MRPHAGRIVWRDTVLLDRKAEIFLPTHKRPVRSAGQSARLFPNLTAFENLLYGKSKTAKPEEALNLGREVAELFRLASLVERMPRQLSGGESQRVSVARAVLSAAAFQGPGKPLLLLDEPFAGLDLILRDALVTELQAWLTRREIPVLSVTHDVGEAFQLGAEINKIADGRVAAQGPVHQVLAAERQRLMEQLQDHSPI